MTTLDWALTYARRGWQVIPLHSIENGHCSCSRKDKCESPGKHPRTINGLSDGSTEETTIRAWWQRFPTSNIGIVTGAVSGIIVLDIDPRHYGDDALQELEERNGPLPRTVEVVTGSGGRHIYFRHPGIRIPCSSGQIGEGIDVRGDGGYVVAPPSLHISGREYAWEGSSEPEWN